MAGIQSGDLVIALDDRDLDSPKDMIRELGRHKPGDTVRLVVIRENKPYQVKLTFARRGDLVQN